MQLRMTLGGAALSLLALGVSAGATSLTAQQPEPRTSWPNSPQPSEGRQVVPFMEGWYDNGDYDDVVLTITSTTGLTDAQPAWQVQPVLPVVTVVISRPRLTPPAPPLPRFDSRGPPSA